MYSLPLKVPHIEHFANGRDFVASIGVIHFQPIQNNVFYGPREYFSKWPPDLSFIGQ